MSAPAGPQVEWPQSGQRAYRLPLALVAAAVTLVAFALITRDDLALRLLGLVLLPAAVVGVVQLARWWQWRRLGLVVDASGITLGGGDSGPTRPGTVRAADLLGARWHVPWGAVYDARAVTDRAALRAMTRAAWGGRAAGGPGRARPAYFPGPDRTLTFRVDLRRAQVPAVPAGVVVSHVWACPVRDVDAVVRALAARGVPVAQTSEPVLPTPEHAVTLPLPASLADPAGTGGRNLAEYEAERVLRHGDAPFL